MPELTPASGRVVSSSAIRQPLFPYWRPLNGSHNRFLTRLVSRRRRFSASSHDGTRGPEDSIRAQERFPASTQQPEKYQKAVNALLSARLVSGHKDEEGHMAIALNELAPRGGQARATAHLGSPRCLGRGCGRARTNHCRHRLHGLGRRRPRTAPQSRPR